MKDSKDFKIATVASSYRPEVTDALVKNCLTTLKREGVAAKNITLVRVPGSLEIPLVAKKLAQKKAYDAIICLGAVFKGNTYHFEQVSNECVRGCMNVSYDFEIPVIFEVLCVYNPTDALERASGTSDNRGVEGALTALSMIKTMKSI